jgi:hypothetical protein
VAKPAFGQVRNGENQEARLQEIRLDRCDLDRNDIAPGISMVTFFPMQLPFFGAKSQVDIRCTEHGGDHGRGRRKCERPVSTRRPMHVVLTSNRARGAWSLRRHDRTVREVLRRMARRFEVRVYDFANGVTKERWCNPASASLETEIVSNREAEETRWSGESTVWYLLTNPSLARGAKLRAAGIERCASPVKIKIRKPSLSLAGEGSIGSVRS